MSTSPRPGLDRGGTDEPGAGAASDPGKRLRELEDRVADLQEAEERARARAHRLRIQNDVLVELSRCPALGEGDSRRAFQEITNAAAHTLNVERVGIWLYNADRTRIRCVELYERGAGTHSSGLELRAADYPAYFAAIEGGGAIAADDAREDPRTSEFRDSYLVPLGITSMMDAPVRLGDRHIGIICHEHVGPVREWTLEEQTFAGSLTEFVALAVQTSERRHVEETLREREEQYRQLIDSVQAIVWRGDPTECRFTFVSEEAETLLGYSVERWLREPDFWTNHLHPDDREWVPEFCRDETKRLRAHEYEFRMIAGDGSIVWLRNIVNIVVRNGVPVECLGVMIDVTERKLAEEAFERQRAFLRQVLDIDPNFVFAKDREGRFTLVNRAVAEAYGTTIEDLIGRTDADYNANPEEVAQFRRDDLDVMDTRREKLIPQEIVTDASGRTRWLQTIKRPIVNEEGRADQVLGVSTDITQRKLAEEALRASEERVRQIIDLVPHMIYARDRRGRFLLANRAVADACGTTVAALVRADGPEGPTPTLGPAVVPDEMAVIESGRSSFAPEERFVDAAGRTRILQTTRIPFRQSGTNEPAVLVVAIDVTERKAADERQALMLRELDHRVKNNLAAVLSIAEQTVEGAESLADFMPVFSGRMRSLAVAHEILARRSWTGAELREIADRILEPYRRPSHERVELRGEPVLLPAAVAPSLSMVLHELASNSAKYGALSVPAGRVSLEWEECETAEGRCLRLRWAERDGPPVSPPEQRGFGTELIEQMIAYQLRGRSDLRFESSGVRCEIEVPVGNGRAAAEQG